LDEAVIKYYRKVLRYGFEHTGSIENPTIFLDSIGENIPICAQTAMSYMHLHINIKDGAIEDIKYLCMCDPTANVVAEILCTLVKGKTLAEVEALKEDSFAQVLGGGDEEFLKKARGIIELINRGLMRYQPQASPKI
jgi:NifU-like protein involved in Fe-S cluster formation